MTTKLNLNRRFETMFDPRYSNIQHRTHDEIMEDAELLGFIKDDFKNNREVFTRVHKVSDKLPNDFMRVRCSHIKSPNTWYNGGTVYFFDPTNKTFRTRRGRNKTNKVYAWCEA